MSGEVVGHVAAVLKEEVQLLRVDLVRETRESCDDGGVVAARSEEVARFGMGANSAEGFVWSADGALFAVITKELGVDVYAFNNGVEKVCSVPSLSSRGIKNVSISPRNNFLIVAESAVSALAAQTTGASRDNAALYHIPSKELGKKLGMLRVRKLTEPFWPAMRWTQDERICFRVLEHQDLPPHAALYRADEPGAGATQPVYPATGAVLHLMNTKTQETLMLPMPGLTSLEISPGSGGTAQHVCCFFGRGDDLQAAAAAAATAAASCGSAGGGARLEILDLQSPKTRAFRAALQDPADSATMAWNSAGDQVLVSATVEVDETGRTYYGRSTLYVLSRRSISGSGSGGGGGGGAEWRAVRASEVGLPLHDAKWMPGPLSDGVFAAVAGAMPGSAGLFRSDKETGKIVALHSLGQGLPRNTLRFSPNGRFLAVGGFGALPGDIDFWDVKQTPRPVCLKSLRAPCTVECGWASSGAQVFGTCTVAPRMRVDNAISVFSYDAQKLLTLHFPVLYAAAWRPTAPGLVTDEPSSSRVLAAANDQPVSALTDRKTYKAPGLAGEATGSAAFAAAFAAAGAGADEDRRRLRSRTGKPSKWDSFPDRAAATAAATAAAAPAGAAPAAAAPAAAAAAPAAPAPAAGPAAPAGSSGGGKAAATVALPGSGWFYRDLEGEVQGPFSLKSMQNWSKQGYFAPELELRVASSSSFVALRELFPAPLTPFKDEMLWPWAN